MSSYQVPEGYKLTEVGVIPEDWEIVAINDIGSVSSGGTPSRTNPSFWNGSIPWITTTQIDFNVITSAEQFITQDGLKNSAAKLFPSGTLLMAMYGQGKTRGKVAILGIEASTNQACATISLNQNLEINYIFYYLISQYESIRDLSNTGNQENLNGLIIKSIKIPLPPLPEQRSIATVLSDIDELLGGLDRLIAKKRDLKNASMQQLLTGKTRLPGFGEGKGYKQTEVGEIPEDWEVRPLRTALSGSPKYGINAAAVPYQGTHPAYIRITDISEDGRFQPENLVAVDHPNSSQYFLEKGDLLFARTGASVGKSYLYNPTDGKLVYAGFLIKVKPDKKILLSEFLSHYVKTQTYWNWVKTMSMRSGQPGINGNEYGQLLLSLPSLEEQTAIATILSDMDAEIATLEQRRDKTRAIKQAVMQELLTGKTRLVPPGGFDA